jgi:hypothetical protein
VKCSCSMFADCSPVGREWLSPSCVDVYTSFSLVNEIFLGWLDTHYIHILNSSISERFFSLGAEPCPGYARVSMQYHGVQHILTAFLSQRPANGAQLPAVLRSSTRSPRAGKNPERQRRVTPPGNRVRFPTLTLAPHSDGEYFTC